MFISSLEQFHYISAIYFKKKQAKKIQKTNNTWILIGRFTRIRAELSSSFNCYLSSSHSHKTSFHAGSGWRNVALRISQL